MRQSPANTAVLARRRHEKRARRQRRLSSRTRKQQKRLLKVAIRRWGSPELYPYVLEAPEHFAMLKTKSHRELVGFLRDLVTLTLRRELNLTIDFSRVRKLSPDGTLLAFAEIKRITARRPGCLRCIPATDPLVDAALCHLGFYAVLGHTKKVFSEHPDVTHWQVKEGVRGGTEAIGPMIESQNRLDERKRRGLVKSIGEAITNVTQHAYEEPRGDGTGQDGDGGWWAFLREEAEDYTVAFCDLGAGVPVTAPKKRRERLVDILAHLGPAIGRLSHQDARYIAATIEDSRTRTELDYRGKGFRDMMNVWRAGRDGYVQVYSNRGCYTSYLVQGEERHDMVNYLHSIHGTLIVWRLTLRQEGS